MEGLIMVPVSPGELLDKISILRIKRARVRDPAKLANVARELELLEQIEREHLIGRQPEYEETADALKGVNAALWEIEDKKRECERTQTFDTNFVELARQVYLKNDERAALKKQINLLFDSPIVEEKVFSGREGEWGMNAR